MSPQVNMLLREAERLDNRSLDDFISNVISLRARRTHTHKEEAMLLERINKSLSAEQIQRLHDLNQKNKETQLSQHEQAELLKLVEKSEMLTVNRLKYLTALARLRNISVRELMAELGIAPTHG